MTKAARGRQARRGAAAAPELRLGWLENALGYHLRRAQAASFRSFSGLAGDAGLRPGDFALLQLVGDNPGIGQTALSAAVARDKSTLTPLLVDLERRGFVRREPDPADRRGRRVSLTPAGAAKRDALAACAARHEALLAAALGPENRALLLGLLRQLAGALEAGAPPLPERGPDARP
ncbi:MarR family winged helix-turn-helix transcriptional regulator [Methylobacterium sp. JK268]